MGKLSVFNFITINGCYKGLDEDISWHRHGAEEGEFSAENLESNSALLFGRVTYQMMASFWPTPMAMESFPDVAKGMNAAEKIVFSKTLKKAEWSNTRVVSNNMLEEIQKMKQELGKDLTLLGSGTILTQLAEAGLIDEYQIMIDPVVIANGTPIFNGIGHGMNLKLTKTKVFKSGTVLLCYEPA